MSDSAILAAVFPQLSNVIVEGVVVRDGVVVVTARGGLRHGHCPDCGQVSWHVHGSYRRRLADLPVGGRPVRILLWVPRFVCTTPECPRRTFSEQVEGLTRRYRRRSLPLQHELEDVAVFLAGRPGARLAARMGAPR